MTLRLEAASTSGRSIFRRLIGALLASEASAPSLPTPDDVSALRCPQPTPAKTPTPTMAASLMRRIMGRRSGSLECGTTCSDRNRQYLKRYNELRAKLTETYKDPGKITFTWPTECKSDAALIQCLRDGKVAFGAVWQWEDDTMLSMQVLANDDDSAVISIGYMSAEGERSIAATGL